MKLSNKALITKLFVLVFSLSALLCCSVSTISTFAAENDLDYLLVEDNDEYYQEALKVLNLTNEEAKTCNIYSIDGEAISSSNESLIRPRGVTIPNNGGFYYFPEFSFSESNGGSYWTCNGNRIKWGVTWHGTYDSNYDLRLGVYLYRYPGTEIDHAWTYNDGQSYTSNWISTSPTDHRFRYYCSYLSSSGTGYATVKMYVATKTL